jgi:hypothetical protein
MRFGGRCSTLNHKHVIKGDSHRIKMIYVLDNNEPRAVVVISPCYLNSSCVGLLPIKKWVKTICVNSQFNYW